MKRTSASVLICVFLLQASHQEAGASSANLFITFCLTILLDEGGQVTPAEGPIWGFCETMGTLIACLIISHPKHWHVESICITYVNALDVIYIYYNIHKGETLCIFNISIKLLICIISVCN